MTGSDCGIATPDYQLPTTDPWLLCRSSFGLGTRCLSINNIFLRWLWLSARERETADLTTRISAGHTSVFLPSLSFKADRLYTAPSPSLSLSYLLLLSQRLTCPRVQLPLFLLPSLFVQPQQVFFSNENCALCMQKSWRADKNLHNSELYVYCRFLAR